MRHRPYFRPIRVVQPLHPVGVWLLRRDLRPFVRLLIAGDSLVGWAPPNFDDDAGPRPSQCGNVISCLERVLLAGAGLLRNHPSDDCLSIGASGDPFRGQVSPRGRLQRPCESSALCIVGFLVVAHVCFDVHPSLTFLPYHCIADSTIVKLRAVREHCESRLYLLRLSLGHLLLLL